MEMQGGVCSQPPANVECRSKGSNMESGGSSSMGMKNRGKKTDRVRRAWTPVEEAVLAELMKELVANGWRSENGFKPGYLYKLEAGMAERLPGTDIRANPHITSRITIWKKCHGSLMTMLNGNSGIGFNTETGMIDCHNDAWSVIVKADPNAIHMRYKAWPLYSAWNEIFGVDKANGGAAEDVKEAVNEFVNEDLSQDGQNCQYGSGVDRDETPVDMDVTSEAPHIQRGTCSKTSGKKRSGREASPTDKLCTVLEKMNKSSDARMDNLVRVFGYEANLGSTRRELFNILSEVPDLSQEDKVDAAHVFAKNPDCLEMFLGMPEHTRALYIRRLLSGALKV